MEIASALVASNGYSTRGHKFPKNAKALFSFEDRWSIHWFIDKKSYCLDCGYRGDNDGIFWSVYEVDGNVITRLRKAIQNNEIPIDWEGPVDDLFQFVKSFPRWKGKLYYYAEHEGHRYSW